MFHQIHVLNVIVNMHFLLVIYLCQWLEDKRFFFICRNLVDYSQLSDSLKEASDMEKAVKELHSKIEDIMFKIKTKEPNMKVKFYGNYIFCIFVLVLLCNRTWTWGRTPVIFKLSISWPASHVGYDYEAGSAPEWV